MSAPHDAMKRIPNNDHAGAKAPLILTTSPPEKVEKLRCSICGSRLGSNIAFLDETGDVPEPRQSWMLCPLCDKAVKAELARSPVVGPLRVRIAVGMVAAERSPNAIRRIRTGLRDDVWLQVLFWGFGIVMLIHIFVIAWIASMIQLH
jgi:hypothetical protein